MQPAQSTVLEHDWFWKQRDPARPSLLSELDLPHFPPDTSILHAWSPTHAFPSEVHVELLKSDRIPDPYVGFNEHKVQCTSCD